MKTEEHVISRYFQRFLDSAAIELGVPNDSVFDLGLIALQLFYAPCSSTAWESFQSSWPHYEVNQITNVEKATSSDGILEVQHIP